MKTKHYFLIGILLIGLGVFVVAQTTPSYIPEYINLEYTLNIQSQITNHSFGQCLIQSPVRLKMVGYYNSTDNNFYFSPSADFNGKCQQGMGWLKQDLTGVTTYNQFRNLLVTQIGQKALNMTNQQTVFNGGQPRWIQGS